MRRLLMLVAVAAGVATAQVLDFGGKVQVEKMKALAFLEGRWEGEAWINTPSGKRAVSGYENVRLRAGGTCLVIDAEWMMKAGDREIPIHQPCAMVFWDADRKSYRMLAQLGNGLRNEFDLQVKERGFVWNVTLPQVGETRYTMNLTAQGEWVEYGEHKNAEGTWTKTLEMRLRKVAVKGAEDR
ncbi:MAG TPA: hypothetical protein PLL78_09795 [Fimbriimonadaceae bacterium]|nr:hypothetical protein [Fimbriimonadaceae bacterium]HRJ96967.1 hypothetical protein [Fimbriimonadaceae bacterium]